MTTRTRCNLRTYQPDKDLHALCRLYRLAIWHLAKHHYSTEACRVWADWSEHEKQVDILLQKGQTQVAEWDGVIAGFGQRYPAHHINMLYVAPDNARRGIASALLASMEGSARQNAIPIVTTHASRVSRQLFEQANYQMIRPEWTERRGIQLERFLMKKKLLCDD